jgi:hypothetical protein
MPRVEKVARKLPTGEQHIFDKVPDEGAFALLQEFDHFGTSTASILASPLLIIPRPGLQSLVLCPKDSMKYRGRFSVEDM